MTGAEVGFVGPGVMGSAMSKHLLDAGFAVHGFDTDRDRVAEHVERGGSRAGSAAEVARHAPVVITSLPSASALRETLEGGTGLRSAGTAGLVVMETSTLALVDKVAAQRSAAQWGASIVDCPMSGTGQQARDGDLVGYLSGDPAAKERALPALSAFTRSQHDLGGFGNGTRVKLIANLLVAIHNASAAEAMVLAQRAGLDLDRAFAALTDGAGSSRMLEVRGPLMIAGEYDEATMRVSTFGKDLAIIAEFVAAVHSPAPLFAASSVLYNAAAAQGRAEQDTASVFAVLQGLAGG